jgi:hypothetical protein
MISRRALAGGFGAAGLGLALVIAFAMRPWDIRTDGPLQPVPNTIDLDWSLAPGVVGTWGVYLPVNTTGQDVTIVTVTPKLVTGIEVQGEVLCDLVATHGCVGSALGFPPKSIATLAVEGERLNPPSASDGHLMALIGVRLPLGTTVGAIKGIRITYRVDGVTYELDLDDSLSLEPGPSGS